MGNGHRLASVALGDTPGRPSASYELVASSTGGECDDKHDGRHLIRVLAFVDVGNAIDELANSAIASGRPRVGLACGTPNVCTTSRCRTGPWMLSNNGHNVCGHYRMVAPRHCHTAAGTPCNQPCSDRAANADFHVRRTGLRVDHYSNRLVQVATYMASLLASIILLTGGFLDSHFRLRPEVWSVGGGFAVLGVLLAYIAYRRWLRADFD